MRETTKNFVNLLEQLEMSPDAAELSQKIFNSLPQSKEIELLRFNFREQICDIIGNNNAEINATEAMQQFNRLFLEGDMPVSKDAAQEIALRVVICVRYLSAALGNQLLDPNQKMALTDAALDVINKFTKVMVGISIFENGNNSGTS